MDVIERPVGAHFFAYRAELENNTATGQLFGAVKLRRWCGWLCLFYNSLNVTVKIISNSVRKNYKCIQWHEFDKSQSLEVFLLRRNVSISIWSQNVMRFNCLSRVACVFPIFSTLPTISAFLRVRVYFPCDISTRVALRMLDVGCRVRRWRVQNQELGESVVNYILRSLDAAKPR